MQSERDIAVKEIQELREELTLRKSILETRLQEIDLDKKRIETSQPSSQPQSSIQEEDNYEVSKGQFQISLDRVWNGFAKWF
jgi:hypothetical protein